MNYALILKGGVGSGRHKMSGGDYVSFHKDTGVIGFKGTKQKALAHIKANRNQLLGVSTHTLGMTSTKNVGDTFR